eukprot:TRINITY_DN41272_c0_g1_i1.p1 TRINITY_DN41272_c0_g1~~TRINITY_DN41272_c0_g1_i1.p1  ORF type:complete len:211 (-),score=74.02 TRINITY_DN41272_c0_g1_i1:222-815(-)
MDANQTFISKSVINQSEVKHENEEINPETNIDQESAENKFFKSKYRDLKKTLKSAVSKNEYLKSELKLNQKKLQFVEEDKYFLLERLLVYEKPPESPQPTQDLSDSDQESSTPAKKPKLSSTSAHPGGVTFSSAFSKLKPPTGIKRGKKNIKLKSFGEFLDSPSGFASLDDDDSSNYAMGGPGGMQGFHQHEDEDSE